MYGEKHRKAYYEKQIDSLREEVIGKHKKCGGTGFIEEIEASDDTGFARRYVSECSCRKKFRTFSRLVLSNIKYSSLINQQIYGKVVFDVVTKESLELRKNVVTPYIRKIKKAAKKPYGFLFLGKNGTGKTFVANKILYYAVLSGLTAHNIEMPELLLMGRKAFDKENQDIERVLNEISVVDFLLIDEVGNESKRSSYTISEFKTLVKKRVSISKPTIIISNYSYDSFKKAYGKSLDNMLRSHCKIFDFSKSVDVRGTKCSSEMNAFFKEIKRK